MKITDNTKFIWFNGKIIIRNYLFEKKKEFHRNQAKLPFDEKIKILVKLQKIATSFPHLKNKKTLVWNI
jgi:hypothetical protein